MNKLTRYEEELVRQLKQLPVPDIEPAWNDMQQLLDDRGPKPPVPPRKRKRWGFWVGGAALLFFVWWYNIQSRHEPEINKASTGGLQRKNAVNGVPVGISTSVDRASASNKYINTDIGIPTATVSEKKKSSPENVSDRPNNGVEAISSSPTAEKSSSEVVIRQQKFLKKEDAYENNHTYSGKKIHEVNRKKISYSPEQLYEKTDSQAEQRAAMAAMPAGTDGSDNANNTANAKAEVAHQKNRQDISRGIPSKHNKRGNIIADESAAGLPANNAASEETVTNTGSAAASRWGESKLWAGQSVVSKKQGKKTVSGSRRYSTVPPKRSSENNDEQDNENNRYNHTYPNLKNEVATKGAISFNDNYTGDSDSGQIADNGLHQPVSVLLAGMAPADSIAVIKQPRQIIKEKSGDDSGKNKRRSPWAIGVALQQTIAFNCNCYPAVSYSATPEAKDYIPSVYGRWYGHRNKWFIQAEFKYSEPQFVQPTLFKQGTDLESQYTNTNYVLRKTSYHPLSLSFHYFVLPDWSVGVGLRYNIFSAEIVERTVRSNFYTTYDSVISSSLIKDRNDSGGAKVSNYLQAVIETEYQWNHWSFGARYAPGIQSFWSYTDPFTGEPASRSNNVWNVFIRYELWRRGK